VSSTAKAFSSREWEAIVVDDSAPIRKLMKKALEDIGCSHTSQGLELDYVGVIVGPDFKIKDGELVSDPKGRARTDVSLHGYKKEMEVDPVGASAKADKIIRNTYRTLMTRGMKGCYIYCTDSEVAKYFQDRLSR
jgi:DUF2075 family protein